MTTDRTVNERLGALETGQDELRTELAEFRKDVDQRFDAIDRRFEQVDQRFDAIDRRFEQVDQRFDAIDQRFDAIDRRFEQVDQRFDAIDRRFEQVDQRFDAIDRRFEQVDQRFDAIDRRFEQVDQRFDAIDRRFEQVDQRFDAIDGQIGGIHRSINALRDDIGQLKAGHALTGALRSTHRICLELGLEQTRVLDPGDLIRMFRGADTADIPNSERNSFLDADVVIEAVSDSGETHYVAVEASFTANGRDTKRAVRNADFLSRFTGQPALAAIAAAHIDNRIRELIDSGQVHWQQLKSVDLEVA